MMNRIELKQEAKGVVRTAAVSAYLFALLYLALTELLQGASVYVNGDVALYMQTYFPNVPIPSYLYPVALPATVVTLGGGGVLAAAGTAAGRLGAVPSGVRRGEENALRHPLRRLRLHRQADPAEYRHHPLCFPVVHAVYHPPVSSPATATVLPSITCARTPDIGVMEAISMSKAQTAGIRATCSCWT